MGRLLDLARQAAAEHDLLRAEAYRLTQDDPQAAERWLFMRWLLRRRMGGPPGLRVMLDMEQEAGCRSE